MVNTRYDIIPDRILTSNEVSAFNINGDKVVASPIEIRRHIFTGLIYPNVSKLIIDTNTNQSWFFDIFASGLCDFTVYCVQNDNRISSEAVDDVFVGAKLIYKTKCNGDSIILKSLLCPPDCLIYFKTVLALTTALIVCKPYYGNVIEKV